MLDNNYKGIYFENSKDQQFYEGGAHFKYKSLVKALNILLLTLPSQRRGPSADSKQSKSNRSFNIMIGIEEKKRKHKGVSRNNRITDLFMVKSYSKTKTITEKSKSKSQSKTINDKKSPIINKNKTRTVHSRNKIHLNNYFSRNHNNTKNNHSNKYNTQSSKKNYMKSKNLIFLNDSYVKKHTNIYRFNQKIFTEKNISKKLINKNNLTKKKDSYNKNFIAKIKNNLFDQNTVEQCNTQIKNPHNIKKTSNDKITSNKKKSMKGILNINKLNTFIDSKSSNNKNTKTIKAKNKTYKNIDSTKKYSKNFLSEASQINNERKEKTKNKIDIITSKRLSDNSAQNIFLLVKTKFNNSNNLININKKSNKLSNKYSPKSRNNYQIINKNSYIIKTQNNNIPNMKVAKNASKYTINNHLLNIPKKKTLYNVIQKNNQDNLSINIIKNANNSSNNCSSKKYNICNNLTINSLLNKNQITVRSNTNTTNSKIFGNINTNFHNSKNNFIEISLLSDSCSNNSIKPKKFIKSINKINANNNSNGNIILKSKINISVINNLNNFNHIENINNMNNINKNNKDYKCDKSRNHPIKMIKMNTNNLRKDFLEHIKDNNKNTPKNKNNKDKENNERIIEKDDLKFSYVRKNSLTQVNSTTKVNLIGKQEKV